MTATRRSTTALLLVALAAAGCGEPSAPNGAVTHVPPTAPRSPYMPPDAMYLWRHWTALLGDTVPVQADVRRGGQPGSDSLSWEVASPDIASFEVVDRDRIRIRALRTGQTLVTARTTGLRSPLSATMRVNVLAPSAEASPIVVGEFRVVELRSPYVAASWGYAPQLTLTNAPSRSPSRVVGLTVELPGLGPVWQCSTDKVVGPAYWTVFAPVGSMDGVYLLSDRAIEAGAEATAQVTVQLDDTHGVRLTAKGRIGPGVWQPGWPDGGNDIVSCE